MNFEAITIHDIELLTALQPAGWQDIRQVMRFYLAGDYCIPLKITENGNIIATGTAIQHRDTAWLAHIIVHPLHRNKGLGGMITRHLIDLLQKKQYKTIYLLATDEGYPVYSKAGFETETSYLFFKDLSLLHTQTSENIRPATADIYPQIIAMDKQASGEERIKLIEAHLPTASVFIEGNSIKGFYFPELGEGHIIATSETAGVELMKIRMLSKDNVAFPVENKSATAFMHQHNYVEFKTAKRMRLGNKRDWKPGNIYNRIGGNLG